jgi:hypothetical protein
MKLFTYDRFGKGFFFASNALTVSQVMVKFIRVLSIF